jgi:hypothetical protein
MNNLFIMYLAFVAFASLVSGTLRTPVHTHGRLPERWLRYHLARAHEQGYENFMHSVKYDGLFVG